MEQTKPVYNKDDSNIGTSIKDVLKELKGNGRCLYVN